MEHPSPPCGKLFITLLKLSITTTFFLKLMFNVFEKRHALSYKYFQGDIIYYRAKLTQEKS